MRMSADCPVSKYCMIEPLKHYLTLEASFLMWLNDQQTIPSAIRRYRKTLAASTPQHVVIDGLFEPQKLDAICAVLQHEQYWQTQKHSYSALYLDDSKWHATPDTERFVQRDLWQGHKAGPDDKQCAIAHEFLQYLRSKDFMALLSKIFDVQITDIHVAKPEVNTNFFRLSAEDFVNQHADDSPGREICMLLYLNKNWSTEQGGELVFMGKDDKTVTIPPLYNRCVLFDPSSEGSEHWVKTVTNKDTTAYRYNVTSWYWSE